MKIIAHRQVIFDKPAIYTSVRYYGPWIFTLNKTPCPFKKSKSAKCYLIILKSLLYT